MAVATIIKAPNKTLKTPCKKVRRFDEETKEVIKNLLDTLVAATNPEGAGLAAPQIGILKRICIAREFLADPMNPTEYIIRNHILINPKIVKASKETELDIEGCLSIPDKYGAVVRPKEIKIKAANENGEKIKISAEGYFARVIQHEMDHLDGILFDTKIVGKIYTQEELENLPTE